MKLPSGIDHDGRPGHAIHIGGVFASDEPSVVRTVLGSCISVCLRDPKTKIGGMNHFMLPSGSNGDLEAASFGIHAMELLINKCMQLGADRRRFESKVFGGGHVLRSSSAGGSIPRANIDFALQFLNLERIPIITQDVGGYAAREVFFFTDSGRVQMKRLAATGLKLEPEVAPRPVVQEDDNITLF